MNDLLDHPPVPDRALVNRTVAALRALAPTLGHVLGLLESSPRAWLERRRDRLVERRGLDRARIEVLLAERADARRSKDFARSDAIRGQLLDLGVEVRDGQGGTTWTVRA